MFFAGGARKKHPTPLYLEMVLINESFTVYWKEVRMAYKIGDKVIHWAYGLGEIINIEEKPIGNHPTRCYVLQTTDLTIWIPVNDTKQRSLRLPTPAEEFNSFIDILTGPSEKLLDDRNLRKDQLMAQIKDGQLASICQVVRDLTHFQHGAKLNDQEKNILERATKSLLSEWSCSLNVPFHQAQQTMTSLLQSK